MPIIMPRNYRARYCTIKSNMEFYKLIFGEKEKEDKVIEFKYYEDGDVLGEFVTDPKGHRSYIVYEYDHRSDTIVVRNLHGDTVKETHHKNPYDGHYPLYYTYDDNHRLSEVISTPKLRGRDGKISYKKWLLRSYRYFKDTNNIAFECAHEELHHRVKTWYDEDGFIIKRDDYYVISTYYYGTFDIGVDEKPEKLLVDIFEREPDGTFIKRESIEYLEDGDHNNIAEKRTVRDVNDKVVKEYWKSLLSHPSEESERVFLEECEKLYQKSINVKRRKWLCQI